MKNLSTASINQSNINVNNLKKYIIIHLPSLPEQKAIAAILSNVDETIQNEKLHKSSLEKLKKGLMQQLLTGKIRVN